MSTDDRTRAYASGPQAALTALTALELAAGLPVGTETGYAPLLPAGRGGPRWALEAALLPALERSPCVVAFSGGRHSAAVLAVATDTARHHGLADPVAVSLRRTRADAAADADWQESVVRHLGLSQWERVYLEDSHLDVLGGGSPDDHAQWPHDHARLSPVVDVARGGALVTGHGAREVLGRRHWWRCGRGAAARWHGDPELEAELPWLTPAARTAWERRIDDTSALAPLPWDTWVREHWWPSRRRLLTVQALTERADRAGALLVQPLQDAGVVDALARLHGAAGPTTRTEAVRDLVGDLVPTDVLSRATADWPASAYVTAATRVAAAAWDGSGLDGELADLVDGDSLRGTWRSGTIPERTLPLLRLLGAAVAPGARPAAPPLVVRGREPDARVPDFFLVGAAKSGTSALHSVLQGHPDVWMGRVKEPHYVAWTAAPALMGPLYEDPELARSAYLSYYEGAPGARVVGDASTSTLAAPGAAAVVAELSPDARVVAVLRDPAERAFSQFVHFAAAGAETTRDFGSALRTPAQRAAAGLPFTYDYLEWSRYGAQIADYHRVLGAERVHVELHEDLTADPAAVVSRILTFLGADPALRPPVGGRVNEGRLPRWPRGHALLYGDGRPARRLRRVVPAPVLQRTQERLRPRMFVKPALDPLVRARIVAELADDVRRLEGLLGRDLTHWRT